MANLPLLFTPTVATNVSGTVDGTAAYPSAGAATFIVGSNTGAAAPNRHIHLRFDVSAFNATDIIQGAILFVKLSAVGGSGCDIGVWGSTFGASMTNADYNLDESDLRASFRQYIDTILTSSASGGDLGYVYIPSQFIDLDTGICDLELRPANGVTYDYDVAVLGDQMTIHGSTAAGSGYTIVPTIDGKSPAANPTDDKPRLMVLAYTPAELAATGGDCSPAIGSSTYVAFGQQADCHNQVKANIYLDLLSSSLDSNGENLPSASIRRERMTPVKMAVGGTSAGGDVAFEVTPDGCTILLKSFFKKISTTGPVSTTYGGTSYNVYTHTFKPAQTDEVSYFTLVQKSKEDIREVYKSCLLDLFTFSVGVGGIINGSFSTLSLQQDVYDDFSAGENDANLVTGAAAYSSSSPLSYVGTKIEKGGAEFDKITNVTLTVSNNTGPTRTLRRKRGPKHIYPGQLTAVVNFDMYFEDVVEIRKYLGVAHDVFPFTAARDIQFDSMDFKFAGELSENVQEWTFSFPKMMYQVVGKSINGDGPLVLSATGIGLFDSATSSSLTITVKNTEPSATFDALTEKITVKPIID